jgi:hypothetical protein
MEGMMRLIRNITKDHRGKFAVVRMQKLPDDPGARADVDFAFRMLEHHGMLEWGEPKTEGEFFVIMLKDRYAHAALKAYGLAVLEDDAGDKAYAADVCELMERAGRGSPFCKRPD